MPRREWPRPPLWMVASLGYVALTLVQTWPLILRLTSVIPHDPGDPLLNMWILWWNAHAVPLTERWWNAPIFWPARGALALSENLLGISILTTPIQWLGGSPITAYNIAFLLSTPMCAVATYALVAAISRRPDAAFVAGLMFGFHPYRVAHQAHIQILTTCWMVVALLALHRYAESRSRRWLCVFGVAWLLQALSNGYYLLFFPVLIGLWVIWFVRPPGVGRQLLEIASAWLIASLPLVPVLVGYQRIHARLGLQRFVDEIRTFSADATSLVDASPALTFWGWMTAFHRPEGELFPGAAPLAAIGVLLVAWIVTMRRQSTGSRLSRSMFALAVLLVIVALSPLVFGRWSIAFGDFTLVSVARVSKPLKLAAVAMAIGIAFEPRVVAARRRRSPLLFYLLAAVALLAFTLGPEARFLGTPYFHRTPYRWLLSLPGYDAVRVPARFAMLGFLCLSIAAALAFARLTAVVSTRTRLFAISLFAGLALIDGWFGQIQLLDPPPRVHALETLAPGAAVLELPFGRGQDPLAMYRAMFHKHPIANGYSGFFPRSYEVVHRAVDAGDEDVIDTLASFGALTVAVDTARDTNGWADRLSTDPHVKFVSEENRWKIFSIPENARRAEEPAGSPVGIASVSASHSANDARFMTDGDILTRWASGPQRGSESVSIDLGSVRSVDAISLEIGPFVVDYPRVLEVATSIEGTTWTTQWAGPTASRALMAAVSHPREVPLVFNIPRSSARFVRLRQLGQDPIFFWSIVELIVYGK